MDERLRERSQSPASVLRNLLRSDRLELRRAALAAYLGHTGALEAGVDPWEPRTPPPEGGWPALTALVLGPLSRRERTWLACLCVEQVLPELEEHALLQKGLDEARRWCRGLVTLGTLRHRFRHLHQRLHERYPQADTDPEQAFQYRRHTVMHHTLAFAWSDGHELLQTALRALTRMALREGAPPGPGDQQHGDPHGRPVHVSGQVTSRQAEVIAACLTDPVGLPWASSPGASLETGELSSELIALARYLDHPGAEATSIPAWAPPEHPDQTTRVCHVVGRGNLPHRLTVWLAAVCADTVSRNGAGAPLGKVVHWAKVWCQGSLRVGSVEAVRQELSGLSSAHPGQRAAAALLEAMDPAGDAWRRHAEDAARWSMLLALEAEDTDGLLGCQRAVSEALMEPRALPWHECTACQGGTPRKHSDPILTRWICRNCRVLDPPGYTLERLIAADGERQIYTATDPTGRRVTLWLPRTLVRPDGALERATEATRPWQLLQDDAVLPLLEVLCVGARLCLVSPFMEGGSLQTYSQSNVLGVGEALTLAKRVARALVKAHEKHVLHLDFRPEHVLFEAAGDPGARVRTARVGGWCLSGLKDALVYASGAGLSMRLPHYTAPEQILEGAPPRVAADVYGFGATLYHALARQSATRTTRAAGRSVRRVESGVGSSRSIRWKSSASRPRRSSNGGWLARA